MAASSLLNGADRERLGAQWAHNEHSAPHSIPVTLESTRQYLGKLGRRFVFLVLRFPKLKHVVIGFTNRHIFGPILIALRE